MSLNVIDILNFELKKLEDAAEKIKMEMKCIDSKFELRIKRMNELVIKTEEIKGKILAKGEIIKNSELDIKNHKRHKILFEKVRNDRKGLLSLIELHNREIEVRKSFNYFSIYT